MLRDEPHRPEDFGKKFVSDERKKEIAICTRIAAKAGARRLERALEHSGPPIIERMRNRVSRLDPFNIQRQRTKERRDDRHRMGRGAAIAMESGKGQLRRARSAANCSVAVEDQAQTPPLCE